MKRNSKGKNAEREESPSAEKLSRLIFFEPDLGAMDEKSHRMPALRA